MSAADPPVSKKPVDTSEAPAEDAAVKIATVGAVDVSDFIDLETFEQIREMDDDDSDEFSCAIVGGFLDQAEETFIKMEAALHGSFPFASHRKAGDLDQLSSLGHFLKGSSATLGLIKVKDYCETIQHLGSNKDDTGHVGPDHKECLSKIKNALAEMKIEYKRVRVYFYKIYPILDDGSR
ncbi:signal transduction histidine kinase [Sphaerosporella brunnea]|uniref:Signal transduction histidine kinase n=1 Tax=Sphaerosporella brunnea TaxID=1250544 RepID=A0A5J5ERU4_9PEZI|nr:signal transduction histidine kinase [Sphaerosporella brunnea]